MKVTTDDASELERVLRDVQEQQRTPKAKHEGYGRELVPFFQPGLDTINTQLVTFPKKGSTEGKEIDCKSNKGKTKTKKEENGSETNNDNADPNRKKKGGNGTKANNPAGANGTPSSGKTTTNAKRGPAFAGPAFSQSPEPEDLPMPTEALLVGNPRQAQKKSSTDANHVGKTKEEKASEDRNRANPHTDLSMELKSMLQVGFKQP
mmetsp:Transcript_6933/g.24663  ORF Transcript_6933/g.24663 Transcript_6933/m.24663 type:complete len:206 (-) Transcript_6933:1724-2341(-)